MKNFYLDLREHATKIKVNDTIKRRRKENTS